MDKKKAILLCITILFIGLLTSVGSYAFWSWSSNANKNIVFNTAKELRNYVIYDEGESKFVGDFKVSTNYTDGIHSTISLYKTSEATNVDLIATIHMDINAIGANMKESSALKWVVTEGDATNPGTVLAKGNFMGSNAGDTLTLVPNIEVTTTVKKYTIWIWLDASENPSDALSGETLDTNVWTEINQTPGIEDRYEVTRISANYQNISATVVDNKNKIVKYAITTENTEPASNSAAWKTIEPVTDQANVYTLNKTVDATGTYYVWFKDAADRVVNAEIEVEEIDNSAPSCSFGSWNKQSIANGDTAQITLTCTDNESVLTNNTININNITTSNTYITVTNVAKEQIANGYKYTVTVKGTETDGNTTLTLQENVVKNAVHLGNATVTSSAITIANVYTVTYASGNSTCTLNETTYGSKTQTYGQAFTIANPSCAGYTFGGWTANSGLDTANAKYGNSSSAVTTTWSNASTPTKATWFNNLALRSTKTVTLTATWTANDLTFSGATLAEGTYGTAYTSGAFTAASNGSGNYTYAIKSGAPTGASIDGTNGANRKIKFTATTAAGTYNVVVTATDTTTGKTKDATFVVKINKQTVNAPTNVAIGTDGKVTWTASSNATGYQISIDNSTWESATSGKDYLSKITAATGSRTVYVRAVNSDTSNYTTPSANATKAVTVYSVALTKGTGISAVSGAGNYISGASVAIDATVSAGYTWSKWTQTSGGTQVSTTKAYSATISSNLAYTANGSLVNYTLTYDLGGGSVSTANPTSYNVETNTITLNNPTKSGYTFDGWTEEIVNLSWNNGFINQTTGAVENSSDYPNSQYSDFIRLKGGVKYTISNLGDYDTAHVRWRANYLDGTYKGSAGSGTTSYMYTPTQDFYVRVLLYDGLTNEQMTNATVIANTKLSTQQIPKGYTGNRKYTANYKIDNPATPTISGGATKVANISATTLTCTTATTYSGSASLQYSFGYTTTENAEINSSNYTWDSYSTSNTRTIAKAAFRQIRYYACRVKVSDGTNTTDEVYSTTTTTMALVNARINLDATTNGGTVSETTKYVPYGTASIYNERTTTTNKGTFPVATKNGYTFDGWYTAATGGSKVIDATGEVQANVSNWTNANKYWLLTDATNNSTVNKLFAHFVDAVSPTVQDIAGGTALKVASQSLTLKCTDNIGVTAYYFGTTNPNTADKITTTTEADLTALQGSGLTKSVTAAGTYYLGCKDAAGNIASKSIIIRKYQVQNVLEKIAGTTGTYTSANYENNGSAATYYVKDGTSLTLASIYSIPTGAAEGTFKGYTTSAPGTSAASPSTTAPTVATNNTTVYYMWFNRNTYTVTASKPTNGTIKIETVTKENNNVTASTAAAELTVKYGDTVKATATPNPGYSFTEWSGGYVSGTTNPATGAAITSNKTITGTFAANTYTINYYQGNGTSTPGSTLIGSSTCTYGESCTLTTYDNLGATFPISSASNTTSSNSCNHYWSFHAWTTSSTGGLDKAYDNGATFTYNNDEDLNLYAIGYRRFYFSTGQKPTSLGTDHAPYQYWNPYSTADAYRTSVNIPAGESISEWTFLGYGNDQANGTLIYNASQVETSLKPAYDACRWLRSKYSRTLTIQYQGNNSTGGSTSNTTATQYYNSGYVNNGANVGEVYSYPSFTLRANGFTKTGYVFSKWADGSTSGTKYNANASYSAWKPVIGDSATKNMYAIWTAKAVTVIFNCNGNTSENNIFTYGSSSGKDGSGNTIEKKFTNTCSRSGYSFNKWQAPNGTNTWNQYASVTDNWINNVYDHNTYGNTDSTITLTATWNDTTLPTGSVTGTVSGANLSATVTATDTGSGVKAAYGWKLLTNSTCNSSTTGFTDNTTNSYTFTLTTTGVYYVCTRIEDKAGNKNYVVSNAIAADFSSADFTFSNTGSGCKAVSCNSTMCTVTLKCTGTLTVAKKSKYQAFLVGGGGGGGTGSYACGGGGGYTTTTTKADMPVLKYYVTIGGGGAKDTDGTASSIKQTSSSGTLIASAAGGKKGNKGSGYSTGGAGGSGGGFHNSSGGSDGSYGVGNNGGAGQGTTTRAFGESSGTLYAGGGSGQDYTTGGAGGGGGGGSSSDPVGKAGTANTGGGGGGGFNNGGAGGSGIVIFRFYNSDAAIPPTCKLNVTSSNVTMSYGSSVTSYGLVKGTTKTYNSKTSLAISAGTFTGFVKNSLGTEATCTTSVAATTTSTYKCCDSQGWYLINNGTECTFQMTQFAPSSTCTKTECPSGYNEISGSTAYCYK